MKYIPSMYRFHFSFAEYSDYNRQNFGVLRVMNDDLVQVLRVLRCVMYSV